MRERVCGLGWWVLEVRIGWCGVCRCVVKRVIVDSAERGCGAV